MKRKLRSFKGDDDDGGDNAIIDIETDATVKKMKLDQYWFWIDDGRSYTKAFIQEFVATLNEKNAKTPHGIPVRFLYCLQYAAKDLDTSERWASFLLDKSRSAGDLICSICHEPFKTCEPYLLNRNGRSYGREAILTAINTLKEGQLLRLEDITIEPEQLPELRLYPNYTLGASESATAISFAKEEIPIKAFDSTQKLENNPAFWDAVAIADNEIWSLEKAAIQFGFAIKPCDVIVIKNQLCTKRKFPWPHPKVNCGSVCFRNCLFRQCEIVVDCWCGPRFHGCRFEDCVFLMSPDHRCETAAKRCEIQGGHAVNVNNNKNWTMANMKRWLQKYLGQEGCQLSE